MREIREAMGLTVNDVAVRLEWSTSKVSRVERGVSDISPTEMVRYAAHCGAHISDIDFLLDWCNEVAPDGYYLSDRLRSLLFHESTASFSYHYSPLVVPGLLQTEEYMTALISQEGLPENQAALSVRMRTQRQHLLHTRGFEFYVHEQALRLPVGDNRVMNEQLLKMVLLADQPQIGIRVVPTALGARTVVGGEFVLFRYDTSGPLIFVDHVGLFAESRELVAMFQDRLDRISAAALDRGQSRELLAALASEFDQPEDSPDDPDHLAEEQFQQ
jgi:transcriptional regulator with XRE-family HTH domain